MEVVHRVSEPRVLNDGRLLPRCRRQHFDDVDGKAFVVDFAPGQIHADGQAFHIQRRAPTFGRFDHITGRVPHKQPHLQRRVVVAVLLAIQILLHEVLVRHPFRSDVVREIRQDASFALLGIEADGDDDSLCGHIFVVFDAAKIKRDCANSWHCDARRPTACQHILPAVIGKHVPPAAAPHRGAGLGGMGRARGNAHAVRCAGKFEQGFQPASDADFWRGLNHTGDAFTKQVVVADGGLAVTGGLGSPCSDDGHALFSFQELKVASQPQPFGTILANDQ